MERIVTLTMNPTIDTSFSVPRVVPERKLRCGAPRQDPGGGGINVSRAVAKLGGGSFAWFAAGGTNGRLLSTFLTAEDIPHEALEIAGNIRENIVAYEDSTGLQYRFTMPGSPLSEAEWRGCLETFGSFEPYPEFVVASGSLPPGVPEDFYGRLARTVRSRGGKFVVDTRGEALRHAIREGVYLAKPNINELQDIFGEELSSDRAIEARVRELIRGGGSEVVIVSLGAGGAVLVSGRTVERVHAPTVPIRSKIGAGDSMTAGIVLKLARGEAVPAAFRYGVAAGSAAVMTPGTELCRKEDTDRLYAEISGTGAP